MDAAERLPVPAGWYCLLPSEALPAGEVKTVRFAGRDVVLFRKSDGAAAVLDSTCPHLGAHLGHGGTIEGDTLRCPFHGFCFDADGKCVKTPYGRKVPPKAIVQKYPVREVDGLVLGWFHPDGATPTWEPPPSDGTGYSPRGLELFDLASHPQETTENSVDLGHLSAVHGYEAVEEIAPLHTDGPFLNSKYRFKRPRGLVSQGSGAVEPEIDIHVWGLGFSRVEVFVPRLGLKSRLWVLPTPTEPGRILLRVGAAAKRTGSKAQVHPGLALLPGFVVDRLLGWFALRSLANDVRQDFVIWSNKRYLPRPALADGDGPVGPYRKWAKQFYVRDAAAEGSSGALSLPVVSET